MESFEKINACKPVAPYLGGKSKLAGRLKSIIKDTPHTTYAEVFVGMGGVFFTRDLKPKAEVINDFNQDVSNLFRILQRHYIPFMEMLKWQLCTRTDFTRLLNTNPSLLTDLERAARFLYLQRTSFGGKIVGQSFGVSAQRPARFDVNKLATMLEDVHDRLCSVVIENLDYKEFIQKYDYEECLFYLDPPYYGNEKDYGRDLFKREEFEIMANLLKAIKGTFILSLNDHSDIRKIFKNFHIIGVETTYTISKATAKTGVKEVIISNKRFKKAK